jgi:ectoine hydroxylase-related dioxygenase (phytanoyl-CoA dioxygenase family)
MTEPSQTAAGARTARSLGVDVAADALDADAVAGFARDGAVCVRGLIAPDRVAALREDVAWMMAHPTPLAQDFSNQSGARFFSDLYGWRRRAAHRWLAFESAAPKLAAAFMAAREVRLLYDQTFVKEPGSEAPTPWHHDLTFWPVTGTQILSAWIALDVVTPENGAVHYLRGSHLNPARYRPTQPDSEAARRMRHHDLPRAPNMSRAPDADLLCWDLEPGDAIFFHALTLHGSGANTTTNRQRRAVVPRFVGEDARFVAGPHALPAPEPVELATGDRLDHPLYPRVWPAAPS